MEFKQIQALGPGQTNTFYQVAPYICKVLLTLAQCCSVWGSQTTKNFSKHFLSLWAQDCRFVKLTLIETKTIEILGLECAVYCSRIHLMVDPWRGTMAETGGQERVSAALVNYSVQLSNSALRMS